MMRNSGRAGFRLVLKQTPAIFRTSFPLEVLLYLLQALLYLLQVILYSL